jgi:hypothetical protein
MALSANEKLKTSRGLPYGKIRGYKMFCERRAALMNHSGREGYGCLGGVTLRGGDLERVGSGNLLGSGSLFNLRSQEDN